jgi:hypothetical protein
MDAEYAFPGDPSSAFRGHESPYPFVPDKFEIVDFTHAIFRAVAFIEVPEPFAGELRTMATEIACSFVACAQSAINASNGNVLLGIAATVAAVL